MVRNIIILAVLALTVAGCNSPHEMAKCKGPLLALNAGHWTPTQDEMDGLNKLCPPDDN